MDATPKGVSPEEDGGQENPRHNALEELAARREQEEPGEPYEEPAPEEEGKEAAVAPEPAQEEEPEPEYEIKVDGAVQKVPLSKLLDAGKRTLQKESAADKRLEDASKKMAELERYQQWLVSQGRQPEAPKPNQQDAFAEKMNAWREAIQYGDAEAGNKALMEYGKAIAAAAVQSALPEIQRSRQEMDTERHNAAILSKFQTDYADLVGDEEAFQAATALADYKLRVEGKPNAWETYAEVGEMVRRMRGTQAQTKPIDIAARQERKRVAETIPAMSGRAVVPQEKEPTREDILADMRGRRAG